MLCSLLYWILSSTAFAPLTQDLRLYLSPNIHSTQSHWVRWKQCMSGSPTSVLQMPQMHWQKDAHILASCNGRSSAACQVIICVAGRIVLLGSPLDIPFQPLSHISNFSYEAKFMLSQSEVIVNIWPRNIQLWSTGRQLSIHDCSLDLQNVCNGWYPHKLF